MDIKQIQNLIRFVSKADVAEVNLKMKDFEIKIKNTSDSSVTYIPQTIAQPAAPQVQAPEAKPQTPHTQATTTEADEETKYINVKSPMIGTQYRPPRSVKDQ